MDIKITGAPTGGTVAAIPSKSAAHRILIAAALSGHDVGPYCSDLSRDITATKECLAALAKAGAARKGNASNSSGTIAGNGATSCGGTMDGDGMTSGSGTTAGNGATSCGGTTAGNGATSGDGTTAGDGMTSGDGTLAKAVPLPCGESGSTLRFLIPVAGVLGIHADMLCEGRLPDRPMEPFLEVLSDHGCSVTGRNPKEVRGRLTGGDFRLPGNISSQYVTGLLMALPLAQEDSTITVEGTLQSRPYIDLTLEVLSKAGIIVEETKEAEPETAEHPDYNEEAQPPGAQKSEAQQSKEEPESGSATATTFRISGGQEYDLPLEALEHVEGDWSNAAFWIAMDAMLDGRIVCTGLDPESSQGDRAITEIIRRIESAEDRELEIDVSDVPDLVPIVSAFACSRGAGAVTDIVNAGRLRFKESDRLQAVTEVLTALGADITELPEGLVIRGAGTSRGSRTLQGARTLRSGKTLQGARTLQGGEISSFGDHRIVMMAAAAKCIAEGDIIIRGAEAVEKSYPRFFEDYRSLGGTWEVIG